MNFKQLIFSYLILLFIVSTVTAQSVVDSDIDFSKFYEVNVSGDKAKIIGMVYWPYPLNITLYSRDKDIALNKYDILIINITYVDIEPSNILNSDKYTTNKPIFHYNNSYQNCYRISNSTNLYQVFKTLKKGEELSKELFNITFLEPGSYVISWKLVGEKDYKSKFVSIATPLEYEQLTKQSGVLEAERRSANAMQKTMVGTLILAIVTGFLAFFSVYSTYSTNKERMQNKILERIQHVLLPIEERIRYDIDYIKARSLIMDDAIHELNMRFHPYFELEERFSATFWDIVGRYKFFNILLKNEMHHNDKLSKKINTLLKELLTIFNTIDIEINRKIDKFNEENGREIFKYSRDGNNLIMLCRGYIVRNWDLDENQRDEQEIKFLKSNKEELETLRNDPRLEDVIKQTNVVLNQKINSDQKILKKLRKIKERYRRRYFLTERIPIESS